MTAATMCSCTSARSNAPALARCVKARRSPTRSWRTAALASLRPTISAPRASEAPRRTLAEFNRTGRKAVLVARPFFAWLAEMGSSTLSAGRRRLVGNGHRLAGPCVSEVLQVNACRRHHVVDPAHRLVEVLDLGEDQIALRDLQAGRNIHRGI